MTDSGEFLVDISTNSSTSSVSLTRDELKAISHIINGAGQRAGFLMSRMDPSRPVLDAVGARLSLDVRKVVDHER